MRPKSSKQSLLEGSLLERLPSWLSASVPVCYSGLLSLCQLTATVHDNILQLPYDVTSSYVNVVIFDLGCNPEYFTVKCVIIVIID